MTSYITNKKPSILKRVLNRLGIIDLPVKVNCWFCNQDSFLLPGTRNTPDHWICHLCDNTNAIDPKSGEIQDPSPFHTTQTPKDTPVRRSAGYTSLSVNNSRSICDHCIQNQALMYDILSKYIPDESDPTYKERYDTVDDEKRRLQNTYKLCDACQSLVDMVVREQMELLNIRNLARTFSSGAELTEPLPKKPSALSYNTGKVIWFFTHCATLLFALHEIYTPYSWKSLDLMGDLEQLYSLIISVDIYSISMVDIVDWLSEKSVGNLVISIVLLNLISLRGLYVHPLVNRFEIDEVQNWGVYNTFQILLFLLRFFFPVALTYRCFSMFFLIYIALLLLSLFMLKKPKSDNVKMRNIGSSTSRHNFLEEEEEEVNDELSVMDIDEPLSVVNNNDDGLESLVFRLQSL